MSVLDKISEINLIETYLIPWSLNIVLAIVIFFVGRMVARVVINLFRRVMANTNYDAMLIDFLVSILNAVLLLFIIIASLNQLGVDTTSLVAILGAAGLAIGLSLQSSLQNFAAGIMLLVFRPIKSGDYVEAAGVAGTIEKISIFSTIFSSIDNKEITVPNGNIYKGNIVNYSARDTRRVDMVFGIGYDSDLLKAKQILTQLLEADSRVLKDPAPRIAVQELAASSVDLMVRPWVATSDFGSVKADYIEAVKLRFDDEGIEIPYPQMQLHVAAETDPK